MSTLRLESAGFTDHMYVAACKPLSFKRSANLVELGPFAVSRILGLVGFCASRWDRRTLGRGGWVIGKPLKAGRFRRLRDVV